MPWCPKCKNEYRAGIAICPDCKESLVEELTEDMAEFVPLFQTIDEERKTKLVKYLVHCGHNVKEESAVMETEEGNQQVYVILVPQEQFPEAIREVQTALAYEAKQESGEEDIKPRHRAPEPSTVYVDAKARYQEYKSSGIMFLVFSGLFFFVGILREAGVIPMFNNTFSVILVFGIAVGFFFVGISSLKKVSSLKEEASTEEQTTDTIMNYLKENFSKEKLLANVNEEVTGELLYFQLMETMKAKVSQEFPDADENYLDALLEDYYNSLEI